MSHSVLFCSVEEKKNPRETKQREIFFFLKRGGESAQNIK